MNGITCINNLSDSIIDEAKKMVKAGSFSDKKNEIRQRVRNIMYNSHYLSL